MRPTTKKRQRKVLQDFWKLLRSGKDYSAKSMYKDVGEKNYLAAKTVGDIVRNHYNGQITDDMKDFIGNMNGSSFDKKVAQLSQEYNVCERESVLILRYLKS